MLRYMIIMSINKVLVTAMIMKLIKHEHFRIAYKNKKIIISYIINIACSNELH